MHHHLHRRSHPGLPFVSAFFSVLISAHAPAFILAISVLLLASCADPVGETNPDATSDAMPDAADTIGDVQPDQPSDMDPDPGFDIPEDVAEVDTDGDCILDGIESASGTDPNDTDSDDDGLDDGVEDSNCNGTRQDGETDPRVDDTDGDGLLDGEEDANANGQVDDGETSPLLADTDNDGLDDSIETGCTDPTNPDTDGDGLIDSVEDSSGNGIFDPERGETDPCSADTDEDGLSDGCEDLDGDGEVDDDETDPTEVDTDEDGLNDGTECDGTPANQCHDFDVAEGCSSDPRSADTDEDSLTDLIEAASNYANGSTDPRNPDTDGDGIPDGLEDLNQDGDWDEELRELDPTTPSTYPPAQDADSPVADTCQTNQLRPVQQVVDGNGDWKLVIAPEYQVNPLTFSGNSDPFRAAVALDESTDNISAFVLSKQAEPGAVGPATELDSLETRLGGLVPFFPRSFTTWDGFDARTARYSVSGANTTRALRNQLIAQLSEVELSTISGFPPPGGGMASSYELVLTVIYRSANRVIVIGALTPGPSTVSDVIRIKMNNLTNATGLGQAVDTVLAQCELFTVTQLPLADFIFVVDDTSSMEEEQDVVFSAANQIFDAVDNSLLDARWTMLSTELEGNSGVSDANICGMLVNPLGSGGSIWSGFGSGDRLDFQCRIRDPAGIQSCDPPPASFFGGREYPMGCAELATNYVQGRNTPAPAAPSMNLQRPDSALVVITLSDENDYVVEGGTMTATQAADYYENFFEVTASTDPTWGPTIPFAISRRDGCCSLFDELFLTFPPRLPDSAAGNIDDLMSIPTFIEQVIQAAGGFASIFNPRNSPITQSMKVVVSEVSGPREILQSLSDGWDYDHISNAMVFYGPGRPQLNDDFALSYRYWEKVCMNPDGCNMQ